MPAQIRYRLHTTLRGYPVFRRSPFRRRLGIGSRGWSIAALTHCDPKEIAAIELALQFKGNLAVLGSLDKIQLTQGPSVGAVWTACETAARLARGNHEFADDAHRLLAGSRPGRT